MQSCGITNSDLKITNTVKTTISNLKVFKITVYYELFC